MLITTLTITTTFPTSTTILTITNTSTTTILPQTLPPPKSFHHHFHHQNPSTTTFTTTTKTTLTSISAQIFSSSHSYPRINHIHHIPLQIPPNPLSFPTTPSQHIFHFNWFNVSFSPALGVGVIYNYIQLFTQSPSHTKTPQSI